MSIKNTEEIYKELAVGIIDQALFQVNKVKVAHPEALGEILLELGKKYHEMKIQEELPV